MKDQSKTKYVLIQELASLRQRIEELEKSEAERKRTEQALRTSEAFLNSIIENSPHAMWISDPRGTLIRLNQACRVLLHITDDEVVGKYNVLQDAVITEQGYLPLVKQLFEQGIAAKFTIEYNSAWLKNLDLKEHASIVLDVTISPVLDSDGSVIHAIIQHIDITERRRAEEALRISQEKLRETHRLAHIGVWNWVAETDTVTWTEELYRIAGLDPMLPAPTYAEHPNIYAPESWDLLKEAVERAMKIGEPYQLELKLIRPDGTTRWVNAFGGATYDNHGRIEELQGTVQDITERKLIEETLHQQNELLRTILDSIPVMIALFDREGHYQFVNRFWQSTLGWALEQAQHNDILAKTYPDPAYRKYVVDYIAAAAGTWSDFKTKTRDGRVLDTSWVNVPLSDDSNIGIGIDITDRKRAEEALREREIQFKKLSFWVPGMIYQFRKRPDGTYYVPFATEAIKDIFGCSPQDVQEDFSPITRVILPEDFDKVVGSIEYSAKHLTNWTCEYRVQIPGQSIRWILGHSTPEKLADGGIAWYGFNTDITERKQTEDKISESELHYRQLAEDMPALMCTFLQDSTLTYVNKAYCELFQKCSAELVGQKILDFLPDEAARENVRSHYMSLTPDNPVKTYEHKVMVSDGTGQHHWHRWIDRAFFNDNGEISHFQSIGQDMTAHKQAEDALRESEERVTKAFRFIPDALVISRLEDGKIVEVNDSWHKVFGYSREEVIGKNSLALNLFADSADRQRAMVLLREQGFVRDFELQIRQKSGALRTAILSIEHQETQGKQYLLSIVQDVTERKWAEEKVRTSHLQLRALYKRLQQIREEDRIAIAREVHDEMGGGLTGLKMDLSWLLRKIGDADSGEERIALMDKIHTSNALIDQMIHVVRRISTDLRPSVLDDLGLIAALEWQLSEFTNRTEIPHKFTTTFEYVNMEKDTAIAVFRIFQEALTNIVRHSRATKVAVVIREGERSLFGNESLDLEIRDNGRGITEEEILNPESLGLLGMKERVLAFGGELSIHGEPGGGTALILQIPRKQGETS